MKTLYLDCGMGAAGDMLTAALLELTKEPKVSLERLNALEIPGVKTVAEKSVKCGITGTHISVLIHGEEEESHDHHHHGHEHHHHHEHEHHHHHGHEHHHHHHEHNSMGDIAHRISHLSVSDKVKADIKAVYELIANAESKVHDTPVENIHFHEVGSADALADIAAVCLLVEEIAPDRIVASPICTGFGQVHCAHGILPVPAPATAEILKGLPIYSGSIEGELCTPTGAALIKHFVNEFESMPVMTIEKIGYGMGKKDFTSANCIRAVIGETKESKDDVLELCCNIDDMTAEEIAYATNKLIETPAVDVYTVPIGMKKSRPGTMLCVLCHIEHKEEIVKQIFKYTKTIGIREYYCKRYVLDRQFETVETPLGEVRKKISTGYGVEREKYEYEDLARLSDK